MPYAKPKTKAPVGKRRAMPALEGRLTTRLNAFHATAQTPVEVPPDETHTPHLLRFVDYAPFDLWRYREALKTSVAGSGPALGQLSLFGAPPKPVSEPITRHDARTVTSTIIERDATCSTQALPLLPEAKHHPASVTSARVPKVAAPSKRVTKRPQPPAAVPSHPSVESIPEGAVVDDASRQEPLVVSPAPSEARAAPVIGFVAPDVEVLRGWDRAFRGVASVGRATRVENLRAFLAKRRRLATPASVRVVSDPPHLTLPKRNKTDTATERVSIDLLQGTRARHAPRDLVIAGIRSEVIEIDDALGASARGIVRLGLDEPISVPSGVDRDAIFPTEEIEEWLMPEAWQLEDPHVSLLPIHPQVCFGLLATASEIAQLTPQASSDATVAMRSDAGTIDVPVSGPSAIPPDLAVRLRDHHRALVDRKGQLLFLLRALRAGATPADPVLWRDQPWVEALAPYGLYVGLRPPVVAPEPPPARDLVVDLVIRLTARDGDELAQRLDAAAALLSRHRTGLVGPVDVDGADPEVRRRVQVVGGAARPSDAVLTPDDRLRLFSRSEPRPGSASDPDFVLPAGAVVVIPDGLPAYLRGRGWSTREDGRLLAHGPLADGVPPLMPFHRNAHERRMDRLAGGASDPFLPPGDRHVYYRGYRWTYRSGGSNRRWDETETEMFDRAARLWERLNDEIARGVVAGLPPDLRNPFMTDGVRDLWPWGRTASPGVSPERLRVVFDAVGGAYHPDAWRRFGGALSRHAERLPPHPRPRAIPQTWEASWEQGPAHDARWLRAVFPDGILADPAVRRLLTRSHEEGPGLDVSVSEFGAAVLAGDAASAGVSEDDLPFWQKRLQEADRDRTRRTSLVLGHAPFNDYRRRGRDEAEAFMATERRDLEGARLAYLPDPAVDGPDAPIEIVPYDPAWRPERSDAPPDLRTVALARPSSPLEEGSHRDRPMAGDGARHVCKPLFEVARRMLADLDVGY